LPKGNEEFVRNNIIAGNIINAIGILDPIPPRDDIRKALSKQPINIMNRNPRIIIVEDLGNYKIYIQIPGDKSEYDFFVWRAIFDENGNIRDLKIPTHDDLGRLYLDLKKMSSILDEYLINATLRFIRDRWPLNRVLNSYFSKLSTDLINEVKKFLLTLKWIAIQEDANYPPPKLGSLYALSVYAILEVVGDLSAIRRVIRFR